MADQDEVTHAEAVARVAQLRQDMGELHSEYASIQEDFAGMMTTMKNEIQNVTQTLQMRMLSMMASDAPDAALSPPQPGTAPSDPPPVDTETVVAYMCNRLTEDPVPSKASVVADARAMFGVGKKRCDKAWRLAREASSPSPVTATASASSPPAPEGPPARE